MEAFHDRKVPLGRPAKRHPADGTTRRTFIGTRRGAKERSFLLTRLPRPALVTLLSRICRAVAQLGRALRSGRRGRGFKSPQPDHSQGLDIPKKTGARPYQFGHFCERYYFFEGRRMKAVVNAT
jgi:hypothetical protein